MMDSRAEQFRALIARRRTRDLPVEELLQVVVDAVARVMQTNVATLYVFDRATGWLTLSATRGLARSAVGFVTLRIGEGVSGRAAAERAPIAVSDVTKHPSFKQIPGLDQSRYQSILACPVVHEQRLLGVINVQTTEIRDYQPLEVRALQGIADVLGQLLSQHMPADFPFQLRGPSLLSRLQGVASTPGSVTDLALQVCAELTELFPGCRAVIALRPDSGPPELLGDAHDPSLTMLAERCLQGEKNLCLNTSHAAAVALPTGGEDRPAALVVAFPAGHTVDTATMNFLNTVAEQVGRAIERFASRRGEAEVVSSPMPRVAQELTQLLLEDRGLDVLVERAVELCGAELAVLDAIGEPLAGDVPAGHSFTVPLRSGGAVVGTLLSSLPHTPDSAVASAAEAIALELAKTKVRFDTESRLRGDALSALEQAGDEPGPDILRRVAMAGVDLRRAYAPVTLRSAAETLDTVSDSLTRASLLRSIHRTAGDAPHSVSFVREREIVVLVDAATSSPGAVAATALAEARRYAPEGGWSAGIGGQAGCAQRLGAALRQASAAADLAARLGTPEPVSAERLGPYRLLLGIGEESLLQEFVETLLAPVIAWDEQHRTDLVKTLEALHANREHLQAAAAALYIHVNTLKYRLSRIEELSGRRLDDASDRFQLYLALYAHRLLTPGRSSLLPDQTARHTLS